MWRTGCGGVRTGCGEVRTGCGQTWCGVGWSDFVRKLCQIV